MTSQTGQQILKMHILPNISRSKENQAMKFDQLKKCSMRNIFLQKSNEIEIEWLVPEHFLFFKKSSNEVKASSQQLTFNVFW